MWNHTGLKTNHMANLSEYFLTAKDNRIWKYSGKRRFAWNKNVAARGSTTALLYDTWHWLEMFYTTTE